jgi:hypothetical protein
MESVICKRFWEKRYYIYKTSVGTSDVDAKFHDKTIHINSHKTADLNFFVMGFIYKHPVLIL